jgi:hypothetical protein
MRPLVTALDPGPSKSKSLIYKKELLEKFIYAFQKKKDRMNH